MDLLISPHHFFGILAEYNIKMVKDSVVLTLSPNFEGSIHLEVQIPGKPYSIITLQIRDKKIVYNKILEWKLATHYLVPPKVLRLLNDRTQKTET